MKEHHGISGFYYDNQLSEPITNVTLHANTELQTNPFNNSKNPLVKNEKAEFKWVPWGQGYYSKYLCGIGENKYNGLSVLSTDLLEGLNDKVYSGAARRILDEFNIKEQVNNDWIRPWSKCYGAIPIASSILSEDYQIDILNTWTDVSGQNTASLFFNTIQELAPNIGGISTILKAGASTLNDNEFKNKALWLTEGGQKVARVLNNHLVMQGNKFSIYLGTSSLIANLNMKFTLFSDWDPYGKEFIDVRRKLLHLYPYFLGNLEMYSEDVILEVVKYLKENFKMNVKAISEFTGWNLDAILPSEQTEEWIEKGAEGIDNIIGNFIGWQQPPAGYLALNREIDACLMGTFKIVFAGNYALENLVGQGMSVTLSKSMVKNPVNPSQTMPMYADVSLNFKCSSSWSNSAMSDFISGRGCKIAKN